jgi:ABC-2 type transport system permease protein
MISLAPRLRRWRAVARIEMLQLIQDRPTLAIILVVPAMQILLFGYAVHFEPRGVPIAIAREQAEPEGILMHAIAETKLFRVVQDGLPKGAAAALVAQHRALVGIEFPRSGAADDVSADTDDGAPERIEAIIDGSDPETVRPAVLSLEAALLRRTAHTGPFGPPVKVTWLYNPEGRTTWSIVPALSGVIVMITMLLLGALTLVRERERGTWEGLLATPISGLDAMIGKLSPYLVLGTVQALVVVLLGHGLFDLPLRGNFTLFLLAAALLALAHLVTGFALSALAQTQVQAIQASVIFYLPSMLLSGFLFPFSGMPRWAQLLGEALPLTHFVRAMRGLLLRGDGFASVAHEMWPVALFTGLAATVAASQYRRHLS